MNKPGIMVILDGTGRLDNIQYAAEFQFSFCRQIQRRTSQSEYFRGVPGQDFSWDTPWDSLQALLPTLSVSIDSQVSNHAIRGVRQIRQTGMFLNKLGAQDQFNIFIAAHSRGGAAAIMLANAFNSLKRPIPIEAMFLFDAVNMTAERGIQDVPANVRNCYHAMRDPQLALDIEKELMQAIREMESHRRDLSNITVDQAKKFNDAKSKVELLTDRLDKTRSNRRSLLYNWGNCATGPADKNKTNYVAKLFKGSHGAMGGTPWYRKPELFVDDEDCIRQVKQWMWSYLDEHGVFDMEKFEAYQRFRNTV